MKIRLLLIFTLLIPAAIAFAQKPVKKTPTIAQQFIVKKQVIADDLELQARDVLYAAIRVYIRYKIAAWLWQKGPDDTMRAEALAVKAVDELYAKKDEMSTGLRYKLITDLFALLDTNAKETSAKLKTKHEFGLEEDLFSGFSQLLKKDGDQVVAPKLLKALSKPGDVNGMINPLLNSLRTMRSPQFPVVLGGFLEGVESGRVTANNGMLYLFFLNFNDPQAPPAMRARYFALIVGRARRAALKPEGDSALVYEMLVSAINSFGELAPDLMPEALGLKNALAMSESRLAKARREAQERIDSSLDKLAATIEEAERAEDPVIREPFYIQAEVLAKNSGKLSIAVDLIDRLKEIDNSEFMKSWSDQEYADAGRRAFERNEVEIGLKAAERVEDAVKRAEAWKTAAGYFDGRKDQVAARDALGNALKLLAQANNEDVTRVYALIRAIPMVQKIDKISLPEAIMLTAKAINDLPPPGIDDKPGTKKYNEYVGSVMTINYSLASVTNALLSRDKTDASDLAERIHKKEVRIVADLVLSIDALETAQKEAEKKEASEKKTAPVRP